MEKRRQRRPAPTKPTTMVTPANGMQQTLHLVTFGSFLPVQFQSIVEEDRDVCDSIQKAWKAKLGDEGHGPNAPANVVNDVIRDETRDANKSSAKANTDKAITDEPQRMKQQQPGDQIASFSSKSTESKANDIPSSSCMSRADTEPQFNPP
ncbi:hypothetical protein K7X08_023267 [Anisodus acutangulus]|uniref:Uncharacterized protein n=1 Tax=Anisodus acutangulus TaxID=402998 RepID=A0A9Q1R2I3_9SOLA|nr:hypothetical protein K7X08_023267 [Anisodus acutangulus]